MSKDAEPAIGPDSPLAYVNREISWLRFARRVLELVEDGEVPLLERVKFAGIMGMLHDEFFMKRMSGLMRKIEKGTGKPSADGLTMTQQFDACHAELVEQTERLDRAMRDEIRPALVKIGRPILDHGRLDPDQQSFVRDYFTRSVLPILTPLAVDLEHPFPFIRNLGLNLGIFLPHKRRGHTHFLRIKVPSNRPRWVPLPASAGFVPLEQVIAANLDLLLPSAPPSEVYVFRVTRGAQSDLDRSADLTVEDALQAPGSIVNLVSSDLKARRFAGVVRLQVSDGIPKKHLRWLADRLSIAKTEVYASSQPLGMCDLAQLEIDDHDDLRFPGHEPQTHPRLRDLDSRDAGAIFEEIERGDILLHHPYHSFDTSVLRFVRSAAFDPDVLAIKLTIYRTSRDSPIVQALAEAARRGKQVAVLVEITARFDEAPNIQWGKFLEDEGAHVAYGVERLKTHVKLALVIREERGRIRRYAHVGTGNYHSGTARIYEDLGVLTSDPEICADVAAVFNSLTGAMPVDGLRKMLVAPTTMRSRFVELIRREADHAAQGRASGIRAKMNQLQDPQIIAELYRASRAGVPISLNVRGLCCLRPGVAGLSETIHVFSVVGRFLEHGRIYRFANGGRPEFFLGSADWMKRNLDNRVETIMPVHDPVLQRELDEIFEVYERDTKNAWDCEADGTYRRRRPREGEPPRAAQEAFIELTAQETSGPSSLRSRDEAGRGSRRPLRKPPGSLDRAL